MLQNKVFTPEVELPSPVLKGIDALPQLRGYVLTTIKPRATIVAINTLGLVLALALRTN